MLPVHHNLSKCNPRPEQHIFSADLLFVSESINSKNIKLKRMHREVCSSICEVLQDYSLKYIQHLNSIFLSSQSCNNKYRP